MAKKRRVVAPPSPIEKLISPFQKFANLEASGGLLLIASTLLALIWANSPLGKSYEDLWHLEMGLQVGSYGISMSLSHWINDGIMAVFFFVVGLEIKREVGTGELNSIRKAALPLFGALGGMIVPAALYFLVNRDGIGASGWGIPMATDIAFALGVLALLGRRIPLTVKVFLTALAIIDDIGAVLVIAIFYSGQIFWVALGVAALTLAVLFLANRLGVRSSLVYLILGMALWLALYKSGIHATLAGILVAMTIPSRPRINSNEFLSHGRQFLNEYERANTEDVGLNETQESTLQALETAIDHTESVLHRMEYGLHPWVTYFIIPIFALANAGVHLGEGLAAAITHPIGIGILAGLALGKPLGIIAFTWLAVKVKLAQLPARVTWRHLIGAGMLAGIGFTMSLFITALAFADVESQNIAKVGILLASLVAGLAGYAMLFTAPQTESAAD